MVTNKNRSPFSLIIYSSLVVTLISTPMWNKDALIIPKVMLLFLVALILLPNLILNFKTLKTNKILRILLVISSVLLIQYVLVMINSSAPFEQQIFGRTGRGFGLITLFSLICILLASALYIQKEKINKVITLLATTGFISAIYGILQSYQLDPLSWDAKNNGVIGTLGNPNFLSSFLAMAFMPMLVFVYKKKKKFVYLVGLIILNLFSIYRAQSTQGYIGVALATSVFTLVYFWYKKRLIFFAAFSLFTFISIVSILGMLNMGPMAKYLYKVSVQSRGDFWRSAFNTANSHPVFGVGIDSFGDYFLKYRDLIAVNHSFAEYTDSAHNYFLDFAAVGGYPLLILNLSIVLLTLYSFYLVQKSKNSFDAKLTAIFCAYLVFQAQSVISPMNIALVLWHMVISGSIIGLAKFEVNNSILFVKEKVLFKANQFSALAVIFGVLILAPYFNVDRLQLLAMNSGNGDLAIKSTKMFPESVLRYSTMSRELLNSGLQIQSLDLARSAVKFNPNSPSLWVLILINQSAPLDERKEAQAKLLELDPLNKEIKDYFN
jgi:O-antigen ligase